MLFYMFEINYNFILNIKLNFLIKQKGISERERKKEAHCKTIFLH